MLKLVPCSESVFGSNFGYCESSHDDFMAVLRLIYTEQLIVLIGFGAKFRSFHLEKKNFVVIFSSFQNLVKSIVLELVCVSQIDFQRSVDYADRTAFIRIISYIIISGYNPPQIFPH